MSVGTVSSVHILIVPSSDSVPKCVPSGKEQKADRIDGGRVSEEWEREVDQ